MANAKQVFISYQYHKDSHYKNLLLAWNSNKQFDFHMRDHSADVSVHSNNASTIKRVLSHKIKEGTCFIVLIGKYTRRCDWVKWEIAKAKELKKKIVAVKIHTRNPSPPELYRSGAIWAYGFKFNTIHAALEKAKN